jgi:DNA-binding MarR family transcriptional regulator
VTPFDRVAKGSSEPYKAIMAGANLDLTEDHLALLALVRDFPGGTPETLAERSHLAVEDVTRLLLELEAAGYIVDANS